MYAHARPAIHAETDVSLEPWSCYKRNNFRSEIKMVFLIFLYEISKISVGHCQSRLSLSAVTRHILFKELINKKTVAFHFLTQLSSIQVGKY